MSQTPDDISTRIRATLAVTIPGLSCELGTPERKIIDACSEAISEAYVDQYLVGSLMDIDTKAGLELEQYVGIFGFGRLQGSASEGVIRVVTNTPSTNDFTYSQGTQFYTSTSFPGSSLYFFSTQAVVLVAGDTSCDIPAQCSTVGSSGNVPPDSITFQGNSVGGSTVTNLVAFIGGVDIETDQELRQRFKDTLLRNVAGTADWYESICQQNNNVSRVKVFGPISLYSTQIATPSTTLTLPVNQDVKYAWPAMESVFDNYGQEDEIYYSGLYDYTYTGGASPTLARISSGTMVVGNVVDLEFQYTTRCSRNDPVNNITNKVDVFVDGVDPINVQEATVVVASTLSSSSAAPLYTGNFQRIGSSGSPTAGNRFMRLGSTPIVTFPSTLTILGVVYTLGTHYHLLQAITLLAGTQQEVSGIEWTSAGPPTSTPMTLSYVYNRIPELLNAIIAGTKQITTDVMVHQANYAYVQPCVQVEYNRAFSLTSVNATIVSRLQTYFQGMPFGAPIKLSNLCMAVQQCQGVDDVKITLSSDNSSNYGVQVYANSASVTPTVVETGDFKLQDNQIAVYQGVIINRVASP